MIFRNKLFAASPTAPTVLEGKVIFCGPEMGFWSPPSAPSLHGIGIGIVLYCIGIAGHIMAVATYLPPPLSTKMSFPRCRIFEDFCQISDLFPSVS